MVTTYYARAPRTDFPLEVIGWPAQVGQTVEIRGERWLAVGLQIHVERGAASVQLIRDHDGAID